MPLKEAKKIPQEASPNTADIVKTNETYKARIIDIVSRLASTSLLKRLYHYAQLLYKVGSN